MSRFPASAIAVLLAAGACRAQSAFTLHPLGTTPGVEIEVAGLDGRISVTLPELINDASRRLVYTDTNLKRVEWRLLPNSGVASSWREDGLASYEITATPERDGILLDWRFKNLSSEPWPDAAGNICMRSHGVPALFDPEGARTFLRQGGQWHSVKDTRSAPGNNWYLPPGLEPLELMQPHLKNGEWKIAPFHPDEAIIAVQSKDGAWTVAQAWKQARYLIANISPKYECTETPPAFGTVAAGDTIHAAGKIYIVRGGREGLMSLYHADLRAGKIGVWRNPASR
jgi:hypothetical protein